VRSVRGKNLGKSNGIEGKKMRESEYFEGELWRF